MKCEKSTEIVAFLRGETPEADRPVLREHFEQCPTCSVELNRLDKVIKALGKMETIEPSDDFTWRVRKAFLQAHPEFLDRPTPERYTLWASVRQTFDFVPAWAISVAAHVLLLAIAAILLFTPKSPEERMMEEAVRAAPLRPGPGAPRFDTIGRDPILPGGGGDRVTGGPDVEGPSRDPRVDFIPQPPKGGTERRDPDIERLDPSRWKERLPVEKGFLAFFQGRMDPEKRKARRKDDGRIAQAVHQALRWLSQAQAEDGRWTGPNLKGEGPSPYEPALTGIALMAFLGEGYGPDSPEFGVAVRRGLDYLQREQRNSGLLGPEEGNYMYNHAIAGLALLEASMMLDDERLRGSASAAVAFSIAAQNQTGGWGYVSRSGENDTSVGGWQILMLRLAKLSGNTGVIPALAQAHDRIREVTDSEGKVGYRGRLQFPNGYRALTAVGMVSHQMSTPRPDGDLLARQVKVLTEQGPVVGLDPARYGMNDLYFGHFGTVAMHQVGGEAWKAWYGDISAGLLQTQGPDGAWPANFDRWSPHGGQVYTTAMGALILETPVRYPRLFP